MRKKEIYKELIRTNMYLEDIRKLLELERKRYLQKDLSFKIELK